MWHSDEIIVSNRVKRRSMKILVHSWKFRTSYFPNLFCCREYLITHKKTYIILIKLIIIFGVSSQPRVLVKTMVAIFILSRFDRITNATNLIAVIGTLTGSLTLGNLHHQTDRYQTEQKPKQIVELHYQPISYIECKWGLHFWS